MALSLVLLAGLFIFNNLLGPTGLLVESKVAALQATPSDAAYVATQMTHKTFPYISLGISITLVAIWLTWLFKAIGPTLSLITVGAILFTGCAPVAVDVFEQVGPNDTAFVTPLVGDNLSGQQKFNSVEYLDSKKVSSKQIKIPLMAKKTGRFYWNIEWIPAVKVWKVQRALVSREWTGGKDTGTQAKNEGVPVVTSDGIKLSVGVAVTTYIEEVDAATYLYYHGIQPLADVTDKNIRNYCISELTREYSHIDLSQAKTNGAAIFNKLFEDAKTYFKSKGITIAQLGNAEGFEFQDPKIQDSINARYIAEQKIATSAQEKLAQDQINTKTIATAQTEVTAAKMFQEAKDAAQLKNQLEIQMMNAKAALTMAEKWNGQLPSNIMPANSPLLFNLGVNSTNR